MYSSPCLAAVFTAHNPQFKSPLPYKLKQEACYWRCGWVQALTLSSKPGLLPVKTFILDKTCVDQVKFYSKVGTYMDI